MRDQRLCLVHHLRCNAIRQLLADRLRGIAGTRGQCGSTAANKGAAKARVWLSGSPFDERKIAGPLTGDGRDDDACHLADNTRSATERGRRKLADGLGVFFFFVLRLTELARVLLNKALNVL